MSVLADRIASVPVNPKRSYIHGRPYHSVGHIDACQKLLLFTIMTLWQLVFSSLVVLPTVVASQPSVAETLAKFPGCAVSIYGYSLLVRRMNQV